MCDFNENIFDCNDCMDYILDGKCPNDDTGNYCERTGRLCVGGAYDGQDGWSIDCSSNDPANCNYRS